MGPETIVTPEVSAKTTVNLIGLRGFLRVRHSCKHDSSLYLRGTDTQLESFPPEAGLLGRGRGHSLPVKIMYDIYSHMYFPSFPILTACDG